MLSIWLICGSIYWYAACVSAFAPTNPLVFTKYPTNFHGIDSNGTHFLSHPSKYNASNNWYYVTPGEYTTFQPFWYSLDVILPVVDLQMENDWGVFIPAPTGNLWDIVPFTSFNHTIRFVVWIETLIGWVLSLMLVAILSGLTKNEKE